MVGGGDHSGEINKGQISGVSTSKSSPNHFNEMVKKTHARQRPLAGKAGLSTTFALIASSGEIEIVGFCFVFLQPGNGALPTKERNKRVL